MKLFSEKPRFLVLAGSIALVAIGAVIFAATSSGGPTNETNDQLKFVDVEQQRATPAQVRQAGLDPTPVAKKKGKKVKFKSFISDPVTVEEGQGLYVPITCPPGWKAISGGSISNFINLVTSNSGTNRPNNGAFDPRIWWVGMTNINLDNIGGPLSYRGTVVCVK